MDSAPRAAHHASHSGPWAKAAAGEERDMRMHRTIAVFAVAIALLVSGQGVGLGAAGSVPHPAGRFTVDVALDGSTWRMDDGTNPFFPVFTGALARGNTFIVSGKIYPGGTLQSGGAFGGGADNPSGPETAGAIGTWVCRGTFNLDIGDIAGGAFPHVTSTQVFTFASGEVIVTEGPEGGAEVLRAIVGGAGALRHARGDVVETPLGVNTSNLFNVRMKFSID
jgi:hypothetical protein